MNKFLTICIVTIFITGCGAFPNAREYWTYQGKPTTSTIAGNEMLNCGFNNTWNPIDMPKNERLKAHLCMEKKGYLFDNKPACQWSVYKDAPACKGE